MWMGIGWGLYLQVVGTHKHYMSSSKFFLPLVVWALKPSITLVPLPLLPLTPLTPSCSLSLPSLSLTLLLLPLLPLAPSHSLSPLAPTEVVGTPKHSITYQYPTLAIGSEREQGEQEGSEREVRGGEREQAGRDPWPNRAGGHPKTCPHKWWGPKNIPLNHHYVLPPLSQLWVRGASWEQGEGLLVHEKWWAPQKLAWQVVGTQNIPFDVHYQLPPLGPLGVRGASWEWGEQTLAQQRLLAPQNLPPQVVGSQNIPLDLHYPYLPHFLLLSLTPLAPLAPHCPLSLPGPLGPSWGLRKPWEPLEAFGSLQKPSTALGLQSDLGALLPLLPLTPSCSLLPPEPPWVPGTFLGPQKALGTFGSLRQPWVFSQT